VIRGGDGGLLRLQAGESTNVGTKNWRSHSGMQRLAAAGLQTAVHKLLTRTHIKELQVHGGCSDLRCGGVAIGLGRDGNDRVLTWPAGHLQGHAVQRAIEDLCARGLIEQAQLRAARVDQHLCGFFKRLRRRQKYQVAPRGPYGAFTRARSTQHLGRQVAFRGIFQRSFWKSVG